MTRNSPAVPLFLDRISDEADYAVIGPTDGREQVANTTRFPYSAICHLEREFGDGSRSAATGFLVDPQTVITAAHCLVSPARRLLGRASVPRRITVIPGRYGRALSGPFGVARAAQSFVPRAYRDWFDRTHDYGLIRLAEPLHRVSTYFKLLAPDDTELAQIRQQRLLHISGYPGDKSRGTQWRHSERLDRKDPRRLFYSIDTCPGHSGSPVWVDRWAGLPHAVIAIHVAGPAPHPEGPWGCRPGVPFAPQGMFNRGIRLTQRHLGEFRALRSGQVPATIVSLKGQ